MRGAKEKKVSAQAKKVNKALDHEVKIDRNLENEIKQLRKNNLHLKKKMSNAQRFAALPLNAKGQVSLAGDQFLLNGSSHYLESLLVPETGPVDIPDEVMRFHHNRAETVTYNLAMKDISAPESNTPAPISGVLILYPNHPDSLIGYNYIYRTTAVGPNNPGFYYDATLSTAQDLKQNYNYLRRISQVLQVRSSTLPSGQYAINGTMNAIRVDGTVSELGLLNNTGLYNKILSASSNLDDKAGNVSVGDGITVLSLPDSFDIPYTRLGDTAPFNSGPGTLNITSQIVDSSENLDYRFSFGGTQLGLPADATLLSFTGNVDSSVGVSFLATCAVDGPGGIGGNGVITYSMGITLYDPFGNVIGSRAFATNETVGPDNLISTFAWNDFIIGTEMAGPVASYLFTVGMANNPTPGAGGDFTTRVDLVISAPIGARPGVNTPVVIVPYQSVAAGSVITLTGISNFELIPNPGLRANLDTAYGTFVKEELDHVQQIISNKHKYNIRSVYNSREYEALRAVFKELAHPSLAPIASQAMGWGDVWKTVKSRVLPIMLRGAKTLVPELAPMANAGLDLLSTSAAGYAPSVARSATEWNCKPKYALAMCMSVQAALQKARDSPLHRKPPIKRNVSNVLPMSKYLKAVPFPVLFSDGDPNNILGGALFVAVLGDHRNLISDPASIETLDGHRIFGLTERETIYPLVTKSDVTLLPIRAEGLKRGELDIVRTTNFGTPVPPVMDHSCDAAIWVLCTREFQGVFPYPITGAVTVQNGVPTIMPNLYYQKKAMVVHGLSLPLLAANSEADLVVSTIASVPVSGVLYTRRPTKLV